MKYIAAVACIVALVFMGGCGVFSAHAVGGSFPAPNDPEYARQWALRPPDVEPFAQPYTRIDEAWSLVPPQAGKVRVAVLDSGFDMDHPDLAANINSDLAWNVSDDNDDVSVTPGYAASAHGTHVAGIFGAVTDNGVGVAGVAYNHAEIVPIKTSRVRTLPDGSKDLLPSVRDTAKGIDKAVELGCRIINISNGTYMDYDHPESAMLEKAVNDAVNAGAVVVSGAGNGLTDVTMYPSDYDATVSVAATTREGEHAIYSDTNAYKDIAAPGGGSDQRYGRCSYIYSTVPDGYGEKKGTSMAAPFVTGVAALMMAANPDITGEEVKSIIYGTATDLGVPGRDDEFGYGLVNAAESVRQAIAMKRKR
ncbi:MAG: S8 family serine peptidase [Clostridiales Family XIII bacterium]|jgi:subtilisin family serine protease|nr:S8 family serine peptidase [Clostridiales Family XIII bacterium]